MTHTEWDLLADAFTPSLTLVFLVFGFRTLSPPTRRVAFLFRAGLALLIIWGLTHLDRWVPVLQGLNGFPSGHMAWTVSVTTSFAILAVRSLAFTIPLGLLYGGLIVFLDYHSGWDLLSATMLAIPVTLLCHRPRSQNGRTTAPFFRT